MNTCKNCGSLPVSKFKARKTGYIPNVCYECEKEGARLRRRADYADPVLRDVISKQNADWRSKRSVRAVPIDWLKKAREVGFLPEREDVKRVFDKLLKSVDSEKPLQSYTGLPYLDNIFSHRFEAKTVGFPSFVEAWDDDEFMKKVGDYVMKSGREPTSKLLVRNVAFSVRIPSHFLPESAAFICRKYAGGLDVFDPFIGWGGRALGAAVAGVRTYVGTDLSARSVLGVQQISRDVRGMSSTVFESHVADFSEFMSSTDRKFNLIFTSPPFAGTEDYGHGTLSVQKWIESVVIPLSVLSKKLLEDGGRVVIHAQDRPGMPVLSSVLAGFLGAGFSLDGEHEYGRRSGQSILVFRLVK